MTTQTGSWTAPDGRELHTRRWLPEGAARGHVALIHGYAEHSGRYARFAGRLVARGFAVHALDLHGHGLSPGVPGDVVSWERLVQDVRAFAAAVPQPRFLFGHSAGGAAAVLAAADHSHAPDLDLAGLVLSSPYVLNAVPAPAGLVWVVRALAEVLPRLPVKALDQNALSREPGEVRAYRDDPLVYTGRTRARTIVELLDMGAAARAAAERIASPLLIVHGGADRIADPEGSRRLFERVGAADKQLEIYPGGFHELLNDLEREQVMQDILAWLEQRA